MFYFSTPLHCAWPSNFRPKFFQNVWNFLLTLGDWKHQISNFTIIDKYVLQAILKAAIAAMKKKTISKGTKGALS